MARKPKWLPFRAVIASAIKDAFLKGMSANAFYRTYIVGTEWAMRRQTFLNLWREVTGVEKLKDAWRFVPKGLRYSENLYVPSDLKFKRKYQHRLKFRCLDTELGEEVVRYAQVATDYRLSPVFLEDYAQKFQDYLIESEPYLKVLDWEIDGLLKVR